MKNILFLIDNISNKAGTERITISLANCLVEKGYGISIVSLMCDREPFFFINENINVYHIYKRRKNFMLNFFYILYFLLRIIKKSKTDILVNVDVIQSLFSLPCKLILTQLKVVSWEHFNSKINLGLKRRDFARFLSKRYADIIVTLTEQDKNFYLSKGKSRVPVNVISNFIDNVPVKKSGLHNKLVIAVGRFQPQKGFDILIDVWKDVLSNSISEEWCLLIIGDGQDKDKVKEKIDYLGLSSSIQIIDATKDIEKYYVSASVYVMTSRFEGLPMVLIEAKSYGLPIISFDCITGPREIIENGIDGFLIEQGCIKDMSEKICLLMGDDNMRIQMGTNSRKGINKYLIENIYSQWDLLFKSLS